MSYFLKLNLPDNPLKNVFAPEIQAPIPHIYRPLSPEDFLTDELLDKFNKIGLSPKYIMLFGSNKKTADLDSRMIHTDLHTDNNQNWKKSIFGINWEILGGRNEFYWWDMSAMEEVWPQPDDPKTVLNGIHYSFRFNLGVPKDAIKLDQTFIDGPTLVRTNVPHSTKYHNDHHNRLGISVRFDETNFNTWEDVLKKLKPYASNCTG